MINTLIQDLYDDFLYDCYVANQRLTGEDWEWYGREDHHIELPDRDGGVLTPLNSQPLTTYQHWKAGILQSEILGKCCFACVPKGVLPEMFEILRIKWARTHNRDVLLATKNYDKMWINDGTENRMILKSEPMPTGWERGRLPFSDEHRANIGKVQKGRDTSHMLKAREGLPNPWVGRKHTEESKEKMRQAKQRRKKQMDQEKYEKYVQMRAECDAQDPLTIVYTPWEETPGGKLTPKPEGYDEYYQNHGMSFYETKDL